MFFAKALSVQCQELKVVKKRLSRKTFERYTVLKSNKLIKHGTYLKHSNFCDDCLAGILEKGEYSFGKKVGKWRYEDKWESYDSLGNLIWIGKSQDEQFIKKFYNQDIVYDSVYGVIFYRFDSSMLPILYCGMMQNGLRQGVWKYTSKFAIDDFPFSYDVLFSRVNFSEIPYENDLIHGIAVYYFENGDTAATTELDQGRIVSRRVLDENGKLLLHFTSIDSINEFQTFDWNGRIRKRFLVKDQKLNMVIRIDSIGQNKTDTIIKNGNGIISDLHLNQFDSSGYWRFISGQLAEYVDGNWKVDSSFALSLSNFMDTKRYTLNSAYKGGSNKFSSTFSYNYGLLKEKSEYYEKNWDTLMITFVVNKIGSIEDVNVAGTQDSLILQNVKKAVDLTSGNWYPARQFGLPVKSYWRFPVFFRTE